MNILVPIDSSDCSFRALEYAVEFANRYDAEMNVIHITDHSTETTANLMDRAQEFLDEKGKPDDVDLFFDVRKFRRASRIGKDILTIAEKEGIDHIVMGHHGTGGIGRATLGSAATTVVHATEYPVTVIP